MPEPTALDAVNDALGDLIVTPEPETPEPETTEPETPEGETPEGETPEGETPEGETTEGEDPNAEKGPNGERERNADGTWKKVEPKAGEQLDKDGKPVKPKAAPDPINDPIPTDVKKATQERIRTLIDTAKTTTAERDAIKKDFDYLIQGVQSTGATPEQYGETLSWLGLFNSPKPEDQKKALELVESVADRLSLLLGVERKKEDPLTAYPDLVEAVRTGKTTAAIATELARTRKSQEFRGSIQQTANTEAAQRQTLQTEEATARKGLTDLEAQLRATDAQYDKKRAQLLPILQPLFKTIPYSQWVQSFQNAYRNLPSQAAAPATGAGKSAIPKNQPLRAGKNPAGGQSKEPSTMLEAINAALGSK